MARSSFAVATVQPVEHGQAGEGEEDDGRVAQPTAEIEGPRVHDLGPRRVAALEERPPEPRQQ